MRYVVTGLVAGTDRSWSGQLSGLQAPRPHCCSRLIWRITKHLNGRLSTTGQRHGRDRRPAGRRWI